MAHTEVYRQGFADALELFESLGNDSQALDMTAHAEPPAMPEDYKQGFRAAVSILRKFGDLK